MCKVAAEFFSDVQVSIPLALSHSRKASSILPPWVRAVGSSEVVVPQVNETAAAAAGSKNCRRSAVCHGIGAGVGRKVSVGLRAVCGVGGETASHATAAAVVGEVDTIAVVSAAAAVRFLRELARQGAEGWGVPPAEERLLGAGGGYDVMQFGTLLRPPAKRLVAIAAIGRAVGCGWASPPGLKHAAGDTASEGAVAATAAESAEINSVLAGCQSAADGRACCWTAGRTAADEVSVLPGHHQPRAVRVIGGRLAALQRYKGDLGGSGPTNLSAFMPLI